MVIEHLTFTVDPAERDEWLAVEEQTWSRFLERQAGFIRKEIWVEREHPEDVHAMIVWESEALWQAIGLFEQATAADPKFAQGYAGQALVYAVMRGYSNRIPAAESIARARDFAERALALDPSLPEPYYAALGSVARAERR